MLRKYLHLICKNLFPNSSIRVLYRVLNFSFGITEASVSNIYKKNQITAILKSTFTLKTVCIIKILRDTEADSLLELSYTVYLTLSCS